MGSETRFLRMSDSCPQISKFMLVLGGSEKEISLKYRNSHPEVFLSKDDLKICRKFTGEHPCRSAVSIKLLATLLKSHFGMGVLP